MKKILTCLILTTMLLSCGGNTEKKPEEAKKTESSVTNTEKKEKETLVASIPPLKWLVQKIAGEDFNVISVIQPNANHELFEPKPDDLKVLENSRIFFTYDLLGFEKKLSSSLNDKERIADVLRQVNDSELLEGHDHDHDHDHGHSHTHGKEGHKHDDKDDHGDIDPHVWFSLEIMPKAAAEIKDRLSQAFPEKKEIFAKNYETFLTELAKAKTTLDEKMSKKTKKSYMIYHPALNYFIKNYKIEEVAVEYEGKEPTAKQIKEIIEEAKEHKVTTILVQPQFPKQSIEIIAKELPSARIVEFNVDKEDVLENLNQFVDYLD